MATVTFGGGPSTEQRRAFAALRDGTHVPGYRGYCPQIKYRVGKTYGTDTHELSQVYTNLQRHPTTIFSAGPVPPRRNEIPVATGDNKYTQDMVPGYTGYIPRMPFKFGGTYKEDCDICIDDFMSGRKHYDLKATDLQQQISGYPRMTSISQDPDVRDRLNLYRDTNPSRPILLDDRRPLTEPPIPGYRGYIPRIQSTELGLGCRYHQSTKNGLEAFVKETLSHAARTSGKPPISMERYMTQTPTAPTVPKSAPASFQRRLYVNDGMIPKYTGYVPQRRFVFGNTYGDTTRSLEVCSHPKEFYGSFVKDKTMYQSVMA